MAERKSFDEKSKNDYWTDQVSGKQHGAAGGSDNKSCQPCLKKGKIIAAVVFCKTCNEFQCTGCSNVHKDFAFMENHELVTAKDVRTIPRACDMKGLDNCDKHRKLLEFFCEDEKVLCCSSCAIVDHRKCHSVVEIQSVARNSSLNDSALKVKLQDMKAKVEIVVRQTHESEKHLDQVVKDIPRKIKKMRDDVMKMFDDLEVSVSMTAAAFQTDTVGKLVKKKTTCHKHVADVTKSMETIENVYRNGTPSQQFIVEHKLKDQVNDLHTKVEKTCRDMETVTVSFDFDETLQLPPRPISKYIPGQLNVKYKISDTLKNIVHEDRVVKLENITSVKLKQTGDDTKEPLYSGLDFLPDGRLVAVDNKNKKCLILSEKLKKVGSYQLSYMPQGVVVVSEEEVAITSSAEYKIDFLRVSKSNDITLIRTCEVNTEYDSICMKDDGNFIVGTTDDTRHVRIVSLSGEEKDFSINFQNKQYPLDTSACTYIRNSSKVVLTDKDEHTVSIYDVATNTRVVVKDNRIKEPRGVTVGPSDCILVCSNIKDSIVQISPTGRILSSNKLDTKFPYSVGISQDKSMLAISNNPNGNSKLQLFKITQ